MDKRYDAAILTVQQTAALTGLPESTLKNWIRQDAIHHVPNKRGWPVIALAGLIEAHLGEQLLARGYTARKAREILESLSGRDDPDYIDQIPDLVTDKAELFLRRNAELTRLRDGQGAFLPVLEPYLDPIVQLDGKVRAFDPPQANFTRIHPGVNGGALHLKSTGVPVFAIVGSLRAGADVEQVEREFEVPHDDVARIAERLDWFDLAA